MRFLDSPLETPHLEPAERRVFCFCVEVCDEVCAVTRGPFWFVTFGQMDTGRRFSDRWASLFALKLCRPYLVTRGFEAIDGPKP